MRFTVVTYGTEGDTRPLVGMCRELMDAGHEVHLLADRSTLSTAENQGVSSAALAGDIKGTVGPSGTLSMLVKGGSDVTKTSKAVAQIAGENSLSWMRSIAEEARSSDAILFSGIASYVGLSVAEHLDIPAIGLGLWPLSPTSEFASPLLPPRHLPGWLNRLSHRAINCLLWQTFRKQLNLARRDAFGQAPRRQMWRDYPILYGISRHLVPQPADWPQIWQVCGAWTVRATAWEPPRALAEFLSSGPPPIYVGFGSMAGFDRSALLAAIIESIAGRRALFYPGWSGIDPTSLPENFFVVGQTPHDWLFPRTSMVIHHGGAGTSHSAARAGIPSVVIPFAGDQFFWAGRLAAAGVAPNYVSHKKLGARALAGMISFAERPAVCERARLLGEAMSQEDGVACAVAHIERLMLSRASLASNHALL
ncbi:MAG TPA: glycosyltransferase [Gallionella sp.]|nr:glycosyltransferase [Gallionella sp.]